MVKFITALSMLLAVTTARAYEVYSNAACEAPIFDAQAKTFYLDPVNGKATNDGLTPQTALPGLQAVVDGGLIDTWGWLATPRPCADPTKMCNYYGYPDTAHGEKLNRKDHANKNWKIPQGSVLDLMTGDHGTIVMRSYMNDKYWSKITAAPGAKPTVHSLAFVGGNRWVVDGLTAQLDAGKSGFTVNEGGFFGPMTNVVMTNLYATTLGIDPYTTSQADLKAKTGGNGFFIRDSQCVSLTNSKSYMTQAGLGLYSNRINPADLDTNTDFGERYILIKGNDFGYIVGQDGVDYAGQFMRIQGNFVHDIIDSGSGLHYDGMQHQPNSGQQAQTSSNLEFLDNVIARQLDAKLLFPGYQQGLDSFDGQIINSTVRNNLVITNHWHCISFAGMSASVIDHNTCVPDGSPNGGVNQPWFLFGANKSNMPTSGIVFTNNVGFQIAGFNDPKTTTVSGNVMSTKVMYPVNGVMVTQTKAGTYGDGNVVYPNLYKEMTILDPVNFKYLATFPVTSPAFGKGFQYPGKACPVPTP